MKLLFSIIMVSTLTGKLTAQVPKDSELFRTLKTQDSLFFERSFNQCDTNYLKSAVHPDLVFYHDQGGIQDRQVFLERVKQNLCSDPNNKPIRKVEVESLEVFPMYDKNVLYGVIQTGNHNFYRREPGKQDVHTSKAKFIHLYLLIHEQWLLKEVLSFDHKDPK